jgi:broad specificity phosphatase PhoE
VTVKSDRRPTTVYLVRHGESQLNLEQRVSGQLDTSLSATGVQQSLRLAEQLWDVSFTGIYTSALRRTIETARPTAEHHGIPIQSKAEFNELHMGVLEGRFRDARDPEAEALWKARKQDRRFYRMPGGERFVDLAERVKIALHAILVQEEGGTILIVGHRNVNRALFGLLMDQPEADWPDLSLKSRSVYRIRTGEQPRMDIFHFMAQAEDRIILRTRT